MKKIITPCLLLIMVCINSFAQYNRTFYTQYSGNPIEEYAADITDGGGGNTCVLSKIRPGGTENGFTVKELDVNGGINFNSTFHFPIGTYGYITATTIIQATGGGYMVAGYVNDGNITDPFASYINANGTMAWFNVFKSNSTSFSTNQKVGLIRAWDDWSTVAYLLVAMGDNTLPPGSAGPTSTTGTMGKSINVIKFWSGSGLIWNKKYFDFSTGGATISDWYPRPETIAYGEDDGGAHKYLIAGSAIYTVPGNIVYNEEGFHMAINGNGTILTGSYNDYASYLIPSYSFGQSAIYDASSDEFILTYTFGNNGMTPNSAVVSAMGISKIDHNNLAINSTDVYYEDVPCWVSENYAFDIKEDAGGNNFIVSGFNSRSDASGQIGTVTLLKVDKTGAVQAFKRYNQATYSYASTITNTVDASSNEYYVMAGYAQTASGDMVRVISTDNAGVSCGHDDINYGTMTYSYSPTACTLTTADLSLYDDFYEPDDDNDITYTDCDPFNPQYKKATGIENAKAIVLNVYPTALTGNEQNVTIEVPANAGLGSVQLFSMDGKKIKSEKIDFDSRQSVQWNTGITSAGIYILSLEFPNTSLNRTIRITKQ